MKKDQDKVAPEATNEAEVEKPFFLKKVVHKDGIDFRLGNGAKVVFEVAKVAPEILQQAALHGFSQKIGDSIAGLSKELRFKEAEAVMAEVVASLYAGTWNAKRESEPSDLCEALAILKKLNVEDVREAVSKASKEQVKAWAANPAVKAQVLKIKEARATKAAKGASLDDIDLNV